MVSWSNGWGERAGDNKILIKLWCEKKDDGKALCNLCNKVIDFKTQGVHAIILHSKKDCHKELSKLRFSDSNRRFSLKLLKHPLLM